MGTRTTRLESFRDLEVRRHAHKLILSVYRLSRELPDEERFVLVVQMRRCAISVPANIAEGVKRRSKRDKTHFYNIAQTSLEELRYYLILCTDLGYTEEQSKLDGQAQSISKMLGAAMKRLSI